MKKILITIIAFFPLLAGATTSSFQFDTSSSDLNAVEVNSVNLGDGKEHGFLYLNAYNNEVYGVLVEPECRDNIYIFETVVTDKMIKQLLTEMRTQTGIWQWYNVDLKKVDGYKNNPIIYNSYPSAWMKAACSEDLKKTIEEFPGFIKWVK